MGTKLVRERGSCGTNSKLWTCSLLLARGEEKEFLDQLTGALGEEIQRTCIRCERDRYFL